MGEINSSLFFVYVRHLRGYIRKRLSYEKITDANVLDFMDDNIFYGFLMRFFEDENKPIKNIAQRLYSEYDSRKRVFDYDRRRQDVISSLREISAIKTILKIIKYSCTIQDEQSSAPFKFSESSVFKIMQLDNKLNPQDWIYITDEQFRVKMICSFYGQEYLSAICPIINYNASNAYSLLNSTQKTPLFIFNSSNNDSSFEELVRKYNPKCDQLIMVSSSESHKSYLRIDKDGNNYASSVRLEKLKSMLKEAIDNSEDYRDISIILAVEAYPSRAYGTVLILDMYILKREENIGYVLHSYANCKITDRVVSSLFFTRMIKKSSISFLLEICKKYLEEQLDAKDLNILKMEKEKVMPGESIEKREYRMICHLFSRLEKDYYKPSVVDYIVYQ